MGDPDRRAAPLDTHCRASVDGKIVSSPKGGEGYPPDAATPSAASLAMDRAKPL
jgi:hypothetical protein